MHRAVEEKADLLALADGQVPAHLLNQGNHHAASLKVGSHGQDVSRLRTELNQLGYTDLKGHPLQPDGHFGHTTEAAVKAFQHDHHLHENGHVGPATQHVMQAVVQPLKRDDPGLLPAVSAMSSLPTGMPGLDDPRNTLNPNHELFNKLKERIPDASEQRLLQFTAVCHANKITDQNLGSMRLDGEKGFMHFSARGLEPRVTSVDIKEPSPPPEQSIQHIQQYDQHQVQINTQINAQIQAQNAQGPQGPVLGGPPMPTGR